MCSAWFPAVEESDIIDLEKRYWLLKAQSRTGRFDLETFVPLVSPPIHAALSEGLADVPTCPSHGGLLALTCSFIIGVLQDYSTPLTRIETITSTSRRSPVGCRPAAGDQWPRDRNVSRLSLSSCFVLSVLTSDTHNPVENIWNRRNV